MAKGKTIIPESHYFRSPLAATPEVFNRVWDDINNAFNKIWDGAVACDADHDVIILNTNNVVTPNSVRITDTTFWPQSATNVSLTFALEPGSPGNLTIGSSTKNGYATWDPGTSTYTWSPGTTVDVIVRMTATYDIVMNGSDRFVGDGTTTSFTLSNTPNAGTVMAYVDNSPATVSTVSGNVVTLQSAPPNGSDVVINYEYTVSNSKDAYAAFAILSEPEKGKDAVTVPKPAIHAGTNIAALYTDANNVMGADITFQNVSLTNETDTIWIEWTVLDNGVEVITDPAEVEVATGSLGNIGTNGNNDAVSSGTDSITFKFKQNKTYTVRLSVKSANNGYTIYQTETQVRILPYWSPAPIFQMSDTVVAKPLNIIMPIQYADYVPNTLTNLTEYYNGTLEFTKATVTGYFGIKSYSDHLYVLDNGDGTYKISTQSGLPAPFQNVTAADLRPGVDYVFIDGEPYKTISFDENDFNNGAFGAVIEPAEGQSIPTEATHNIAIGVPADQYYVRLEVYDESNYRIYEEWADINRRMESSFDFEVTFDSIPYGSQVKISAWARFGNIISPASGSSIQKITPAAVAPTIGTPAITSLKLNSGETIAVRVDMTTATNAFLYEVSYDPDGTNVAAQTHDYVHQSSNPILIVPVDPGSTSWNVTYTVYDKYGRKASIQRLSEAL